MTELTDEQIEMFWRGAIIRNDTTAAQMVDFARQVESATLAAQPAQAPTCTCPSGDGSLRWPCPVHPPAPVPAPVQAGDPVAEVCSGWRIAFVGSEPIAAVLARHPEVRIGTKLYTHPAPPMGSQEPAEDDDLLTIAYMSGHFDGKRATPQPSEQELFALLPYAYYMDPPDGGSPTLLEQLQRMAKDAQRYRWLRANVSDQVPFQGWWRIAGPERPERLDEAIDAEIVAPPEFKQEQP
jgi:hypothetical protein